MSDEPKTLADWEAMDKPMTMKLVIGGENPANLDEADAVIFKAGRNGMAIFDPAYVKWLVENSNAGLLDEYHRKPRFGLAVLTAIAGIMLVLASSSIIDETQDITAGFIVLCVAFGTGCGLLQYSGRLQERNKKATANWWPR